MRLRRYAGGSAAIAASVTVMWSAAVLLPAEPLRSIHASGSPPVLSHRGGGRRIPEDRAKLAHDRDVGHRGGTQRDRDRRGDQHHAPAELRFPALEDERRVQARVRPHWLASLRSRIPPAWPTRPSPPEATSRARSQDVSFIAKGAPIWKFLWCGIPHHRNFQIGAPFAMKDTSWDRALEVASGGEGLVGHAGGILLRKLANQCGLTLAWTRRSSSRAGNRSSAGAWCWSPRRSRSRWVPPRWP